MSGRREDAGASTAAEADSDSVAATDDGSWRAANVISAADISGI